MDSAFNAALNMTYLKLIYRRALPLFWIPSICFGRIPGQNDSAFNAAPPDIPVLIILVVKIIHGRMKGRTRCFSASKIYLLKNNSLVFLHIWKVNISMAWVIYRR